MGYTYTSVGKAEVAGPSEDGASGALWVGALVSVQSSQDGEVNELTYGSVCIVSVLRIVHVHGAAQKGNVSSEFVPRLQGRLSHHAYRPTGSGSYAAIWSTVEINVAIICSSLIVMKPLLVRVVPSIGTEAAVSAHQEDSAIRRVMSIATLEESLADNEEAVEARYEACVWSDSSERVMDARAGPKKGGA